MKKKMFTFASAMRETGISPISGKHKKRKEEKGSCLPSAGREEVAAFSAWKRKPPQKGSDSFGF